MLHTATCSVFTMSLLTECCLQVLVCPTRGGMDLQVRQVVAGRWAEAELLTRHDMIVTVLYCTVLYCTVPGTT